MGRRSSVEAAATTVKLLYIKKSGRALARRVNARLCRVIVDRMQHLDLLTAFDFDTQLPAVLELCDVLIYESGAILLEEGQCNEDWMFLLLHGSIDILIGDPMKLKVTISAPDYVGESSLKENARRNATLRAKGEVQVLKMTRAKFIELYERFSGEDAHVMSNFDRMLKRIHIASIDEVIAVHEREERKKQKLADLGAFITRDRRTPSASEAASKTVEDAATAAAAAAQQRLQKPALRMPPSPDGSAPSPRGALPGHVSGRARTLEEHIAEAEAHRRAVEEQHLHTLEYPERRAHHGHHHGRHHQQLPYYATDAFADGALDDDTLSIVDAPPRLRGERRAERQRERYLSPRAAGPFLGDPGPFAEDDYPPPSPGHHRGVPSPRARIAAEEAAMAPTPRLYRPRRSSLAIQQMSASSPTMHSADFTLGLGCGVQLGAVAATAAMDGENFHLLHLTEALLRHACGAARGAVSAPSPHHAMRHAASILVGSATALHKFGLAHHHSHRATEAHDARTTHAAEMLHHIETRVAQLEHCEERMRKLVTLVAQRSTEAEHSKSAAISSERQRDMLRNERDEARRSHELVDKDNVHLQGELEMRTQELAAARDEIVHLTADVEAGRQSEIALNIELADARQRAVDREGERDARIEILLNELRGLQRAKAMRQGERAEFAERREALARQEEHSAHRAEEIDAARATVDAALGHVTAIETFRYASKESKLSVAERLERRIDARVGDICATAPNVARAVPQRFAWCPHDADSLRNAGAEFALSAAAADPRARLHALSETRYAVPRPVHARAEAQRAHAAAGAAQVGPDAAARAHARPGQEPWRAARALLRRAPREGRAPAATQAASWTPAAAAAAPKAARGPLMLPPSRTTTTMSERRAMGLSPLYSG